ncbi:hypothetical protein SAMN05421805_110178 [Saccharopolyspora antimicrobica]|uniref:Uncharacterized protein n=1 Tax=Saccharopolyspora antimicrobica TaxID=455193 RepID=A0A1I5F5S2_9PSEU|nr:hypothetical protein [Saccharopolyspora antimicrobica]RKT83678.1 hypothetical protein ATL45_1972 [Saccharopolyspora antimicrobica]SFO18661.1 hypothetical protein SAMN05421805_110178 [Saccharopolyspora antimicrobica]
MTERVPASIRYKELTALATTAAQQLRKRERARVAELSDEVAAGQQRKDAAAEERDKVIKDVESRWEAAIRALWHEKWMKGSVFPEPDRSAPRAKPEKSVRAVQAAYLEFNDALERLRFGSGFLRRKKSS